MSDFSFYFRLGWAHIMSPDALDHILFLLALAAVYALADWRRLLVLVTAFTIGHSATLALSTLRLLALPTAVVEFLIPCTIVVTAVVNLFRIARPVENMRLRYLMAFLFGLIHGLGFANTLRFILAGDQSLGWALFGFNVGLEVGQILVVFMLLLVAWIAMQGLKIQRRDWVLFLSAAVFSLALQLTLQRWPEKEIQHGEQAIKNNINAGMGF
jgi:hypothetical protein